MSTYQVGLIEPKAIKLLEDLEDLGLIKILKPTENRFKSALEKRKEHSTDDPNLEESLKNSEKPKAL